MRRVMLKLSGESLAKDKSEPFCNEICICLAKEIAACVKEGIQVVIVFGGGNIYRGRNSENIDRYKADFVGMLATCMNAIYFSEYLKNEGIESSFYSTFEINGLIKLFNKDDAINDLNNNKVVFCVGGTGHPYFTTDSGMALRAIELNCDEILMAKSIDYVYDKDPNKFQDAKKIENISFSEILDKRLNIIDLTSAVLLMENKIPCILFSGKDTKNIGLAIKGQVKGTKIYG